MSTPPDPAAKRVYDAPVLTTFGDIGQLTHVVGRTGNIDGGNGSMSKTKP